MKMLNSFQSVAFFAACPFGISWLNEQSFKGAGIAFWLGCIIYIVSFLLMIAAVRMAIDRVDW